MKATLAVINEHEKRETRGTPEAVRASIRRGTLSRARLLRLVLASSAVLVVWSLAAWSAALALVVGGDGTEAADALVVLGGAATYVERTRLAAELYKQGRAPFVVLTNDGLASGWSSEQQRNPLFVERAADELRRAGVPGERIEILPAPLSSTFDEAVLLRSFAATRNLRSLLVVTSGYHTRRALWTLRRVFRASGVRVAVEPVAPGEQTPRPALWWLTPAGWKMVAGEYLKLGYYVLRYH